MNEEIRKIVEGYISEGDYEKALSLLMKFPLDDEQDKALLESCKKEFATSCASAIAEAAKAKNKDKAELILSSYKHLLGEDTNTILYQTIVDGIQEQKAQQPAPQQPVPQQPVSQQPVSQQPAPQQFASQVSAPQPPTEQKKEPEAQKGKKRPKSVIERILKKPALLVRHCAVGEDFGSKPILWKSYLIIAAVVLFLALIGQYEYDLSYLAQIVGIVIALTIPVCHSKNKLFQILAIVLLTISSITVIPKMVSYGSPEVALLTSIVYAVAYFFILPGKRNVKKGAVAVIALIILFTLSISSLNYDSKVVWWLTSIVFAVVYFFITPGKRNVKKGVVAALIFTILYPLSPISLVRLIVLPLYKLYSDYYYFNYDAFCGIINGTHLVCYVITIAVCFASFVGVEKALNGLRAFFKKAKAFVVANKKLSIIVASTIVVLIVINAVFTHIKNQREEEERRIAAIEQARLDSIQAIENERIRAEEARKAAIEKARQDSIREVQRREQARRDSIAEIEHAAFVKKYARIGVIVEYMTMTRGTEDGEGTKGIKFRVFNPTKKTIKYVIISAYPVDRFGSRLYYTETCRGIGPVSSHDWASWSFDNVFPDRNDVIDDLKVSMQVVYTDGSSKSINVRNATVSKNSYEYYWFRD